MKYRSDQEILGREDVNDLDSILVPGPTDPLWLIEQGGHTRFCWEYDPKNEALRKLYEKGKSSQWNVSTDLDWSVVVDQAEMAEHMKNVNPEVVLARQAAEADPSCPMHSWGEKEYTEYGFQLLSYFMSNLQHGEQGALLATLKVASQTPTIDAKYYAATQTIDEARHVEVFNRYLKEKMPDGHEYPVTPHFMTLSDAIIEEERWDVAYLGMQVMVEGLALAAFNIMLQITEEPLLKKILRYVMADEARHVAFGTMSLKGLYDDMSQSEIRDRQEFCFEAGILMRDKAYPYLVWEHLGLDTRKQLAWWMDNVPFTGSGLLFSKIIPNLKKLGLIDAGDGWLRKKYEETDLIQYENWTDVADEYGTYDAVAEDRVVAANS